MVVVVLHKDLVLQYVSVILEVLVAVAHEMVEHDRVVQELQDKVHPVDKEQRLDLNMVLVAVEVLVLLVLMALVLVVVMVVLV